MTVGDLEQMMTAGDLEQMMTVGNLEHTSTYIIKPQASEEKESPDSDGFHVNPGPLSPACGPHAPSFEECLPSRNLNRWVDGDK